jgi:hypothetical protein
MAMAAPHPRRMSMFLLKSDQWFNARFAIQEI